ncbi:alpha/beta hydrolase [Kordiimonas lacus]|uniref:Esterase n=1 Tax=Kordiimonas lacus TaxID=637679 RepID=A0A1G6ZKJ0_9PROT|nr:alpha/beta hydrolase-fold protein [Kordiimonas lacus]SDE03040.1 hypothetical protein SAMN04488071_1850 [Kordiimonas lacus]
MPRFITCWRTIACLVCLLLAVPSQAEQTVQHDPVVIGHGFDLQTKVLGQTRRINVYLPPSYEGGDKAYPVLYMPDGGVREDFIHIAGIASLAADYRKIREFILVGVENIDRYHDLLPPSATEIEFDRLKTAGGSDAFRTFLKDELIPYVNDHYRTTSERALMGESAAGLFVLETFLKDPALFSGYVAVSPSLWWDDQALAKEAPALIRANPAPKGTHLFLTIGNEGQFGAEGAAMREGTDMLAEALRAANPKGLNWTYAPMEQESHGTIFHPAALKAIRRIFATPE